MGTGVLDGTWIVPVAGWIGAVFVATIATTWKAGGVKSALERRIDEVESDLALRIEHNNRLITEREAHLKKEFTDGMDIATKITGDGLAAMREKIHETEDRISEAALWNRDNLAKQTEIQNIMRTMDAIRSEMNAAYQRVDTKLDAMRKDLSDDRKK